jgi:hypothetical protein
VAVIVPLPRTCSCKVRHFTSTGSWEWYDHDHDGSLVFVEYNYIVPTLHNATTCTDTLQLQALGSGTIRATTAPLVFVEYDYIVPTP